MFKEMLPHILKYEGGYVNHPDDRGGATNFGVTQKTYDEYRTKNNKPYQDVLHIKQEEINLIYFDYWRAASCDKIEKSHPYTAGAVFDCSINSGPKQAIRILQKVLKASPVDGIVGNITLDRLHSKSDIILIQEYNDARQDFFIDLVINRPNQIVFLKGWLRRLNHLRRLLDDWSRRSKE